MATIKKKKIGSQTYYYLEQSARVNGRIEKKEKYLGKEIPENIEEVKKEFIQGVYKEKWFKSFNQIKANYSKEQKIIPISAKIKETGNFAIKFTYNSNRIEGSKLTLRETANLLEKGITPSQKPLSDIKEAESHKKVFYEMIAYKKELSLQIISYWHKILFENTKKDIAGKIRAHGVRISGSKFIPPFPAELNILLREFFGWYSKNKSKIHPIELAALTHLKFVTIHPFSDGNGRISRVMMNFILNRNNYPMLDIPYEKRNSYYTALERSQVKKNEQIFAQWLFKKYLKENKRYLKE